MIFKRIFKGANLEFNVHVEKTEYKPGETVRGLITLHTDEGSRARQFRLFAEGKESTSIKVEESTRVAVAAEVNGIQIPIARLIPSSLKTFHIYYKSQ